MRKVDVAEWILSFTTTPERAASTAGDLMEDSVSRGSAWFWWSLIRTTASQVWNALTLAPLQMARFGFVAVLIQAILVPPIAFVGIVGGLGLSFLLDVKGSQNSTVILAEGFATVGYAVSHLLIGRWLGRRAPGREFAAFNAFILMMRVVVIAGFAAIAWANRTPLHPVDMLMGLLSPVEYFFQMACLLAGAAWARRAGRRVAVG
jgi:hypothetical protein